MTWTNPPDKIIEARDAIISCTASTTLGLALAQVAQYHYPTAALKTDTIPFCTLEEAEYSAERSAPGESYARGRVLAIFTLDPAVITMGSAERACKDLANQLCELTGDNIFITGATRTLASKVRKSKTAATVDGAARSYYTIQVSMDWEG